GEVEAALEELLRQLAGAVGAEVEEDRGVVAREARPALEHDGLDELVGHAALVARSHGGDRVVCVLALALDDRVVGALRAIPAAVAVHRVVAARYGGDSLR